jgi:subtilisin family serine protease
VLQKVSYGAEFKQGEVIVKYKSSILRMRSNMNQLYSDIGVNQVRHYSGFMKGFEHLVFKKDVDIQRIIDKLKENPMVEYAQPNYLLHILPVSAEGLMSSVIKPQLHANAPCLMPGLPFPPGCDENAQDSGSSSRPRLSDAPTDVNPPVADPDLDKAYGIGKVGATQAWSIHRGDKSFIVADIDTGIDYNHEDLAGNVWRGSGQQGQKDAVGYDFIHNDALAYDDNGHGTHTAGVIGAVGGNGVGISGVAQKISIMALKFLTADGSGTTADAIRAIDYAIQHGARVLNNSWGGRGDPDNLAIKDAVERARDKNVLFVAAAGNDGTDNDGSDPAYPASFDTDNIIAVTATDATDSIASFANYGKKTTHLAAPGVNIYSTVPNNGYRELSGTSMACPHVSGAAALLWSKHPSWNYKQVKAVLLKTVDPVSGLADKTITGGRLNVAKAISYQE